MQAQFANSMALTVRFGNQDYAVECALPHTWCNCGGASISAVQYLSEMQPCPYAYVEFSTAEAGCRKISLHANDTASNGVRITELVLAA
jgi:hypothetical protein